MDNRCHGQRRHWSGGDTNIVSSASVILLMDATLLLGLLTIRFESGMLGLVLQSARLYRGTGAG